ncbi:manganese efflux pump MntP family protein [Demequina sp. TTPB684]|uniref:manganese efflux pump MntP n=1 Tax=unclassified Demequina TaxID=2620311 RepID=UPI001CF29FA7|nr:MULTISPECIES: manganese efflux pump MntP family protein [unclassified Demequina]MCB2412642.1 manganese efflux pump MntP family protein [Demequina sp. TTPB684]UPU87927.1 manganese efflux pump MntP family protein [Demequina sp. TMPB413]
MSFIILLLTAVGLAADAFAVSVSKGLQMRHFRWAPSLAIALTFGLFQGLMPVMGWALGSAFSGPIAAFDHWLAFGLLTAIGAKMVWEARVGSREEAQSAPEASTPDSARPEASTLVLRKRELLTLGVATSIDALAVGISLAVLDVNIAQAAVVIAVITAALSLAGVRLGHHAGRHLGAWAELFGGLVLIGIGVKILIEHLVGA